MRVRGVRSGLPLLPPRGSAHAHSRPQAEWTAGVKPHFFFFEDFGVWTLGEGGDETGVSSLGLNTLPLSLHSARHPLQTSVTGAQVQSPCCFLWAAGSAAQVGHSNLSSLRCYTPQQEAEGHKRQS